MTDTAIKILTAPQGKTHLFFIGQAGFVIKSSMGTTIAIDLYLSDCVERYDGFKRLMPKILYPNEVMFDYVVATHWHYDHFDVDAMPILLSNSETQLIATMDCRTEVERLGIHNDKVRYITVGETIAVNDIVIQAVFCDHGINTPHAIGLVVEVDGKKIYISGDTALRLDKATEISRLGPFDLMIAPINGAFGNLNEQEAVELCKYHKPGLMIPCHYWNFAEQHGDPGLFIQIMKEQSPDQEYRLIALGEAITL